MNDFMNRFNISTGWFSPVGFLDAERFAVRIRRLRRPPGQRFDLNGMTGAGRGGVPPQIAGPAGCARLGMAGNITKGAHHG
jgi:hypothetical protein